MLNDKQTQGKNSGMPEAIEHTHPLPGGRGSVPDGKQSEPEAQARSFAVASLGIPIFPITPMSPVIPTSSGILIMRKSNKPGVGAWFVDNLLLVQGEQTARLSKWFASAGYKV